MNERIPKVGIGVIVFKDGKILLGKRKNAHGEGEYAPPGGKLDYLESFFVHKSIFWPLCP